MYRAWRKLCRVSCVNSNAVKAVAVISGAALRSVFTFGEIHLDASQVFHVSESGYSYASVNLKPVVPGHCLIVSMRPAACVSDLSTGELSDLMITAQRVGCVLKDKYDADGLTFVIQDGAAAGQTVSHVHMHVLPRKFGDFEPNDRIYDEFECSSDSVFRRPVREPRSASAMAAEANALRAAMEKSVNH